MRFFEPNIEKMQKRGDARGLIKLLSDKDPCVRRDALEALFRLGLAADLLTSARAQKAWPLCELVLYQLAAMPDPNAVGPLVALLADTSSCLLAGAAESAVQTLDKLGWRPARIEDAPPLYMKIKILEYIKNEQSDVCVQIGEPAIPHLLELLRWNAPQSSSHYAMAICDVLERIGEPAVAPLIAAIGSRRDERDRSFDCYLVQMLGQINNPPAYTFLLNSLDKNVQLWIRRAAIDALGEIGHGAANATDALLEVLNTEALPVMSAAGTSEDYVPSNASAEQVWGDIRISAATALGRIGDLRAVDPLIFLCQRDWNRFLRAAAFSALGSIGDLRAVETLRSALIESLNDYATRFKEAKAIVEAFSRMKVKDSGVVDLLFRSYSKWNGDRIVADAFIDLCGLLDEHDRNRIREALFAMLGQDLWAAIVLGKMGDERALPFLIPHLADMENSVVSAAIVEIGAAAIPSMTLALLNPDSRVSRAAAYVLMQRKDVRSVETESDAPQPC